MRDIKSIKKHNIAFKNTNLKAKISNGTYNTIMVNDDAIECIRCYQLTFLKESIATLVGKAAVVEGIACLSRSRRTNPQTHHLSPNPLLPCKLWQHFS